MPTSCGYTAEGERFTYLEARPFLELVYIREHVENTPREMYEALEYLVLGAKKLSDTWTVGTEPNWDCLVFRCWWPRPAHDTIFEREVSLAA